MAQEPEMIQIESSKNKYINFMMKSKDTWYLFIGNKCSIYVSDNNQNQIII